MLFCTIAKIIIGSIYVKSSKHILHFILVRFKTRSIKYVSFLITVGAHDLMIVIIVYHTI